MMTAKRTDLLHAEIRDGLRQAGYWVWDTHELGDGFPDLMVIDSVGIALLEVKSKNGRLTPAEERFWNTCPLWERLAIVRSLEQAFDTLAAPIRIDRDAQG
jgi:hypothetical protein